MNVTPELVALLQREREHRIREDHLARLATRIRDCCRPSLIVRLARAARRAPAAC
jgi:hypothetical protein